jgi:hypothetical protein
MLSPLSILVKIRVALMPGRIARTMTPNSASSMFSDSLSRATAALEEA